MPRGDRTGPMGMGQMTGKAMGDCEGMGAPALRCGSGLRGGGRGRGMGMRRAWADPRPASAFGFAPATDEVTALKNQARGLEQILANINDRIKNLESAGR